MLDLISRTANMAINRAGKENKGKEPDMSAFLPYPHSCLPTLIKIPGLLMFWSLELGPRA